MSEYKVHLFICTNAPDKAGKCGSKMSEELRQDLKDRCRNEFGKSVRVNASGCLGFCERGITAVIYPQGRWLFDLKKEDGDLVFEEVRKVFQSAKEG